MITKPKSRSKCSRASGSSRRTTASEAQITVKGIEPPEREGEAQVVIRFEIDSNGVLTVRAYDRKNLRNSGILQIINDENRLTKEEIEKLVGEATKLEEEEK